jgi:hypothetical protein
VLELSFFCASPSPTTQATRISTTTRPESRAGSRRSGWKSATRPLAPGEREGGSRVIVSRVVEREG